MRSDDVKQISELAAVYALRHIASFGAIKSLGLAPPPRYGRLGMSYHVAELLPETPSAFGVKLLPDTPTA